jgi:hypothetical protein
MIAVQQVERLTLRKDVTFSGARRHFRGDFISDFVPSPMRAFR